MQKKVVINIIVFAVVLTIAIIGSVYGLKNIHRSNRDLPPKTEEFDRGNMRTTAPVDLSTLSDSNNPGIIASDENTQKNLSKSKYVPILMYHAIEEKPWGLEQLFVRTSEFDSQIKYLSENGYTPLLFNDLKNFESFSKPIIITFDDGYRDNYYNSYPILKKYNFKAVIFLIVNYLDTPSYLTTGQIKEMGDVISFQSHTLNHYELDKISDNSLVNECLSSKMKIEEITGKPINAISYPCGLFNQNTIDIVSRYYDYAVTTKPGYYSKTENNYQIKRVRIQRSDTLTEFIEKLPKA